MKLFLSYAREQSAAADEIAPFLAARGHDVFFDRFSLPPGEEYDAKIREHVEQSDVFIFLISPDSIEAGGYTTTELQWRRAKWPNPSGRTLPVMVEPTLASLVESYLRAVTILYPQGNLAAEIVAAVDRLQRPAAATPAPASVPETDPALQHERIHAYKGLWEHTNVLPKWPRARDVEYQDLRDLSEKLRDWYFAGGGGLFLSRAAHNAYSALQNGLTATVKDSAAGVIEDRHYDEIRELCSALRSQLARDIGARS